MIRALHGPRPSGGLRRPKCTPCILEADLEFKMSPKLLTYSRMLTRAFHGPRPSGGLRRPKYIPCILVRFLQPFKIQARPN